MNPGTSNSENSPGMGRYGALVVRHAWVLLLSAFFLWALALAASLFLPRKFRSETMILIEQPKVLPQYVVPNVANDMQQRMQSLTQQILSRTRLVMIMDTLQIYGKRPDQPATEEMVQRMRNDIAIEVTKAGGHSDELSAFKVSYSAPSAALAQAVVEKITRLFIDENVRSQEQLSEDTTAFLDNQLAEARKDLEHQEELLGQFRSKYLGELPEQLSSNVQILSGLQSRLQSATGALHQAEQQRLYLVSLIGQSRSVPHGDAAQALSDDSSVASSATSSLDDQIDKMEADLADLTARYTPQHPDVVRLKEQIAAAEALRRQSSTDAKTSTKGAPARSHSSGQVISPLAQLESQLKANELEIANRKQEVQGVEAQIEQYQARLNLTPIREQQLADVARNHEQSRTNYESLLAKKLQSGMATDLAKRQQGDQFTVIDPPSLPLRPYWPNPVQFSLAGLGGGLAAGLAWVLLKEMARPRVNGEEDLRQWSTIKVLGTIPPLRTHAEQARRARRQRLEIVAGLVLASLIPLMTMVAYARH